MSIGILFGELSTIAAMHDLNQKIDGHLAQRLANATHLKTSLTTIPPTRDVVSFGGREGARASALDAYHQQDATLMDQVTVLFGQLSQLRDTLTQFQAMREQNRVTEENKAYTLVEPVYA